MNDVKKVVKYSKSLKNCDNCEVNSCPKMKIFEIPPGPP